MAKTKRKKKVVTKDITLDQIVSKTQRQRIEKILEAIETFDEEEALREYYRGESVLLGEQIAECNSKLNIIANKIRTLRKEVLSEMEVDQKKDDKRETELSKTISDPSNHFDALEIRSNS